MTLSEIRPYQACRTTEGWIPIEIPSTSREAIYTVLVCPWQSPSENICECEGYLYGGYCKHQEMAQIAVCGWTELQVKPPKMEPEFVQTKAQRKNKICPRCGGPTLWRMEVDESDDAG